MSTELEKVGTLIIYTTFPFSIYMTRAFLGPLKWNVLYVQSIGMCKFQYNYWSCMKNTVFLVVFHGCVNRFDNVVIYSQIFKNAKQTPFLCVVRCCCVNVDLSGLNDWKIPLYVTREN